MILKNIFENKIDRTIEGVIKADDLRNLHTEIDEYVLTNELEKRLDTFLDAYNNYSGANGVWISGFFGSGKSHLLKMLALLLENRDIDGQKSLDLFLRKCKHNKLLSAQLEKAAAMPSKSILFNIDQKADVTSKESMDSLVGVFVRVFDEMCGYYGKQGFVAQFERDLDHRKLLSAFKEEYAKIAGKDWSKGREQYLLEKTNISNAYAKVSGEEPASATGIIDNYRNDYNASIDSFVTTVRDYIDRQPGKFRLNFFVDEVGQYIVGHPKLMVNLQTIAETLNTKCQGKAWIIVTAQDEVEEIVGQMSKRQGYDFSKIQDRFKIRMKLTSKDVAEVIQKRLLRKNKEGNAALTDIYSEESNNFRTLFDFTDGARRYRNYADKDHFLDCYPFVPYQFELFQSVIIHLSQYDAFEGRYRSVGERSMLAVFQQVVKEIAKGTVGQLATFDHMFEGIRASLKAGITYTLHAAEKQLDDDFEKRLLKTLLLVKYAKDAFKATPHNLSVLMIEGFDQDISALQKKVQEALNHLEQQHYIQRNGDLYEYLTNEEQNIEKAIKNVDVENDEIAKILNKVIFDEIITVAKIRYKNNNQDFSFAKKLDGRFQQGRNVELCINIYTPIYEHEASGPSLVESHPLVSQNSGTEELLVLMPQDIRLVQDLILYRQTEKYCQQHNTTTQNSEVKGILEARRTQNADRLPAIQRQVHDLLSRADLYVKGNQLEISEKEPKQRIQDGFQVLIEKVYPNLGMLESKTYSESDVRSPLKKEKDDFLLEGDLPPSEQEVLNKINTNKGKGVRTILKGLLDVFERKPYGWSQYAVLCQLAKLIVQGKVEVSLDSNVLESKDLEEALLNSRKWDKLILELLTEYSATEVNVLRNFFREFFPKRQCPNEAKALGAAIVEGFRDLAATINGYTVQPLRYPCVELLQPIRERLQQLADRQVRWFFQEFTAEERKSLLEEKETILDPIINFMDGKQRNVFDDIRTFVDDEEYNFLQIEDGEDVLSLQAILTNKECFRGNALQKAKANIEIVRNKIDVKKHEERQDAEYRLAEMRERLRSLKNHAEKPTNEIFAAISRELDAEKLIVNIRARLRRFEENEYADLLKRFAEMTDNSPDFPQRTFLHFRNIKIHFEKPYIENESDLDHFMESLRNTLLMEINQGKKVQL